MKKLLAAALAIVMVLSMSVMAFATTYEATMNDEGQWEVTPAGDMQTELKTLTHKYGETGGAANYTITIPATVEIPWEGTPEEFGGDVIEWSYAAQLNTGDTLAIAIDSTTGSFENAPTLTYELTGDTSATVTSFASTTDQTIDVAVEGWDTVPVDEYTATVTFTADYTAA